MNTVLIIRICAIALEIGLVAVLVKLIKKIIKGKKTMNNA